MTQQDAYRWDVIGEAFLKIVNRTLVAAPKAPRKRKIQEA